MFHPPPVLAILLVSGISLAADPPTFSFLTRTDLHVYNATAVVSADFNHDGIRDLALLSRQGLHLFLGEREGRFHPPVLIPMGADRMAMARSPWPT